MKDFDGRILNPRQQVRAALDALLADRKALEIGEYVGDPAAKNDSHQFKISIVDGGGYYTLCPMCSMVCEFPPDVSSVEIMRAIDYHMVETHRLRGRAEGIERVK